MKIEAQLPKCVGCSKGSFKGEFDSNKCLLEEQRKISNNLTLYFKELEQKENFKPKVSSRREITKIRAEINEIETSKTIEKINKTKI